VGGDRGRRRVREAKKALYQQLVLEAAEAVFASKGYEEAKIEEIARESGLSLGTLYSVFEGKAEVFRAVHEHHDAALLRRGLDAARGIRDPLEALLAGVRGYVGYFLEHPDFLRMNLQGGITWGTESAGAESRERTEAWKRGVAMLSFAIGRCVEAGALQAGDPKLLARMMIAMQQVQLAHWIESGMQEDPAAVVMRIAADVRRFFAPGAARPE
jgi:AcrR family transcriptional regulator